MNNNGFQKIDSEGTVYFRCTGIDVPHGFSTRHGGVSQEPHLASMNLGKKLGDDPAAVEENYKRIARAVGFDSDKLVFTNQIHSCTVRFLTKSDIGETFDCDGFVTDQKDIVLSVRTADCVPILFYEPQAHVIGAVHAGWRGSAGGIQKEAVKKMRLAGAEPSKIRAAIGPCIHECCYEVKEDFYLSVVKTAGEETAKKHIRKRNGRLYADLVGMNREALLEAGLAESNIFISERCTCCEPELFFSHRASMGKRGVMAAFITL